MRRIAIKVEYDGTDFEGWQLQAEGRTVQGAVEEAVGKAAGSEERVTVHGAGRTDAGVHAEGQVAHFDTACDLAPEVLVRAINHWLPGGVSCRAAAEAAEDFHARFGAAGKLYRYRVLCSAEPRPLRERYCLRVFQPLDAAAMGECARAVAGEHDFASFASESWNYDSTVRTVTRSEWIEAGDEMHYLIEADGFLYNMVRALVGTMLEAGEGKLTPEAFAQVLEARDRKAAGRTAPAHGLTLVEVHYPPECDPFCGEAP